MQAVSDTGTHRWIDAAMLRASAHLGDDVMPSWWPGHDDQGGGRTEEDDEVERWYEWLREAWARDEVADAVRVASPALAAQIRAIADGARPGLPRTRRAALALARYLVRMRGRATPFGLFAGVAPIRFVPGPAGDGDGADVELGWAGRHRLRVRPDAARLDELISRLELIPQVRRNLSVVRNDLAAVRGERLLVPLTARSATGGAAEVSVRHSAAVRLVLGLTDTPMPVRVLVDTVISAFPDGDAARVEEMVARLIDAQVLITCLRPPATVVDPLAHVMDRLAGIDTDTAPEAATALAELHDLCARAGTRNRRAGDTSTVAAGEPPAGPRPGPVVPVEVWAVDLGLDALVALPEVVAREAAAAASALLRLSPDRRGLPAWRAYHARFLDRFGPGATVPLAQLVDPTAGLGFPEHLISAPSDAAAERGRRVTGRDEALLGLAHQAAATGTQEVVLDDAALDVLDAAPAGTGTDRAVRALAPHLDVCVELRAPTRAAVTAGRFSLAVLGVGRTGLATSGRFLDLMPDSDQHRMLAVLRALPTAVAGAAAVQLSFPPLPARVGNVARVRPVLPTVLSLGEHPPPGEHSPPGGSVSVADLAVTADHQALYLISRSRRAVIEPVLGHAVAGHAMPALVRFLAELPRAATSTVSLFDWGIADCLPVLPRLRRHRAVLAEARWRLDPRSFPSPDATPAEWRAHLDGVRERLRLPDVVAVGGGDRRLRLDLDAARDLDLLRDHLARARGPVTVTETSRRGDHGWLDGRAHEILIPLARTTPPAPAPEVLRRPVVLIDREHGLMPGSRVLSVRLTCHPDAIDTILTTHLPELITPARPGRGEPAPRWWFLRVRRPDPHLRLRLHTDTYGATTEHVGAWASQLRSRGLVGDLVLDTYRPELARYTLDGDHTTMDAAEAVFAADSTAARAQVLATAQSPGRAQVAGTGDGAGDGVADPVALVAASMVDLARALTGGRRAAAEWLVRRADLPGRSRIGDRRHVDQARALCAVPMPGWATLLGRYEAEVARAWAVRRRAVHRYRATLLGATDTPATDTADDGTAATGTDAIGTDAHNPGVRSHAAYRAAATNVGTGDGGRATATLPDTIVVSLLHLHHVRALGPDPDREALCHRLARSVALTDLTRPPAPENPT